MTFFACSIFSGNRSQRATTRPGLFFDNEAVTKVPRLPVPITPTVMVELTWALLARSAEFKETPIILRRDKRLIVPPRLSTVFPAEAVRDRRTALMPARF